MRRSRLSPQRVSRVIAAFAFAALLALPASALGAPKQGAREPSEQPGTLVQLPGKSGCLADRSAARGCTAVRALKGPGPFMGSRAIALSPDGKFLYVASSRSDAIAIFARNKDTGRLLQRSGTDGCIALKGAGGCARAIGLNGPNSVALSPDGRYLYATARGSNAVTAFRRNRSTGALSQLRGGAGCVSGLPVPGCGTGRGLVGPDVLVVSPDGINVYVGSFFGNAVAVFARSASTGALAQPEGTAGCIAASATSSCATALGLEAPEGMAISADGTSLYVAAALSNALVAFARDTSTGVLTQSTDGSGCIVESPLTGCTTGVQLSGANAVTVSPDDDDVYVTSLLSDSVTSFSRSPAPLAQKPGTAGCLIYLRAAGCSFGRALSAPEGLAVSPDGRSVYAAAFASGAIAVLDRGRKSGALAQKPGRAGCIAPKSVPGCSPGRALRGVSSIAVSPDGRNVYSTSFGSNAVDVFRRNR